jgi:hypothetical protein
VWGEIKRGKLIGGEFALTSAVVGRCALVCTMLSTRTTAMVGEAMQPHDAMRIQAKPRAFFSDARNRARAGGLRQQVFAPARRTASF